MPGYWGRMDHGWRARGDLFGGIVGTSRPATCAVCGSTRWCSTRTSSTVSSAHTAPTSYA
jgi:hypothetical protein